MKNNKCKWEKSWSNGATKVIDCAECGFKHQYPYPEQNETNEFYEKEYYETIKPQYLEGVKKEHLNRVMWANDKLEVFDQLIKYSDDDRRILDVGCSFGTFLSVFKDMGWDCVGIEPSIYAAKYAREVNGLTVHQNLLENISMEELRGSFDVVHIKQTLDHLINPIGFIERCSTELLKKNGVLCIETANQFSEMQMAIIESSETPMWWIVPDHIAYFDKGSLTSLVNKYGFEVKYEMSTFPMELFPLIGNDFVAQPELGKDCHKKRLSFEDKLNRSGMNHVRIHFYEALAKYGYGRGIIQISQRADKK